MPFALLPLHSRSIPPLILVESRQPSHVPPTEKKVQTCNRCGGFKKGSTHGHLAAINSSEYCTIFEKLSKGEIDKLREKGFPKPGYGIGEEKPIIQSNAKTCGVCGLKKEGELHPSKYPFCKVVQSNWKEGHVRKVVWAKAGGGEETKKRQEKYGIIQLGKNNVWEVEVRRSKNINNMSLIMFHLMKEFNWDY